MAKTPVKTDSGNKTSKQWILPVVLMLIPLSLSIYNYISTPRLAYVDTNEMLSNYVGMKIARADFQKKSAAWKANVDTLMMEVQKSIQDYEKEVAKMTPKEKDLSRQLIQTKQEQLRNYQQAIQQQSQQEDQKMTEAVLATVNAVIKEYGDSHNYKIIIGATNMGNVVYAKEGMNISDEILILLNKQYGQ